MFQVEIIEAFNKPPKLLNASQVVIRMPNGTPVSIAALFGGPNSVLVSHCKDPNFQADLQKVGIKETVIVENLK